jgi:ArsR family metal-binding transcriptional regulator
MIWMGLGMVTSAETGREQPAAPRAGRVVTTFPNRRELDKATRRLDAMSLPYEVIRPDPSYGLVGVPALVMDADTRMAMAGGTGQDFTCSGWADCFGAVPGVPQAQPPAFDEDVFGTAAIMLLAQCVADRTRIRIIAHISGDLGPVFPYLNAEMPEACYNPKAPTLTYMDGYRMVSLYPHRIAVAKADDIVDAWRVLESIRCRANDTWGRRGRIQPSYEMREKPPALEIFKRLPGTNCGLCGEQTCLAFALKLWAGETGLSRCQPIFQGDYAEMKDALVEICAGLGLADDGPAQQAGPKD